MTDTHYENWMCTHVIATIRRLAYARPGSVAGPKVIPVVRYAPTLLSILAGVLLMWPPGANAQTVDGSMLTQVNPGAGTEGADQLQVTISLAGAAAFDLGTSTLMFTYNTDALAIPSGAAINEQLVDGTDYQFEDPFIGDPGNGKFYGPSTVTVFGVENRLSVNIVLDVTDFGQPVLTSQTPVVTLFFDITDPNQAANLAWVTSEDANPTVVQLDDNQTSVTLGAFTSDDTELPVELMAFEATADGPHVQLHWETANEVNNAGFEIQAWDRGGAAWERIGFVEGAGTTLQAQTYGYQVRDLGLGTHRFRLKQIDFDGAFDYSPEVEVTLALGSAYVVTPLSPNPARGAATFELAVREQQHVTVLAYDVLGRRIATLYDGAMPANRTERIRLDGRHLPSGLYFLRAVGEGFAVTRRVTLVR